MFDTLMGLECMVDWIGMDMWYKNTALMFQARSEPRWASYRFWPVGWFDGLGDLLVVRSSSALFTRRGVLLSTVFY